MPYSRALLPYSVSDSSVQGIGFRIWGLGPKKPYYMAKELLYGERDSFIYALHGKSDSFFFCIHPTPQTIVGNPDL